MCGKGSGTAGAGRTESTARARPRDWVGGSGWREGTGERDWNDDRCSRSDDWGSRTPDGDRGRRGEERGRTRAGAAIQVFGGPVAGGGRQQGSEAGLPSLDGERATQEGMGGFRVVLVVVACPFDGVDGLRAPALLSDDPFDEEVGSGVVGPEKHGVWVCRRA